MSLLSYEILEQEITFKASKSGGSGGQHVNKVSSKIELVFDIQASSVLTESQKEVILKKLKNRINKEGVLKIITQEDRSQFVNKSLAIEKFMLLINNALKKPKRRIATKPSKAKKEKRLSEKRMTSETKSRRKKDF